MASKKEIKSKKAPPKDSKKAPIKTNKPVEIDTVDILPETEEKAVDEENPLLALEDEDTEEVASLDDEDLNPFGDKWEQ